MAQFFLNPIPLTFQIVYLEPEGARHPAFNGCRITSECTVPGSLQERERRVLFS